MSYLYKTVKKNVLSYIYCNIEVSCGSEELAADNAAKLRKPHEQINSPNCQMGLFLKIFKMPKM